MANLNVGTVYLDSAQWTAMAGWLTLTSYPVGSLIRQTTTPTVGNERAFVQVNPTTHVSGASEPAWSGTAATRYQSFTDATCTWIECTGNPGVNGDTTNAITWTQQHASSIAVTVGLIIYDPGTASLQIVTTAGNLGSSAPTFSATAGTITNETGAGTAHWTSLGLASAFASWKAPFARLQSVIASTWTAAGQVCFVGDDHAETSSSSYTWVFTGTIAAINYFYCVDHTASVPPGTSNLKTTASFSVTGNSTIAMDAQTCSLYFYGCTFNGGNGSNAGGLSIGQAGFPMGTFYFDVCVLALPGTGAGIIAFTGVYGGRFTLNNTTMSFGAATQSTHFAGASVVWRNTPSAIAGTVPTTLISQAIDFVMSAFEAYGVDFSALGSGHTLVSISTAGLRGIISNCKLGSGVTLSATPSSPGAFVDFIISDSAATTYQQWRYWYEGTLSVSTAIVRTGGAVVNGTPIGWSLITTANSNWIAPLTGPASWINNPTTGSNVDVIVYGIWFGAALPKNDQIWHDVEYLGSSGSPLASLGSGTKANNLATGSSWAADTSAWDSAASAWISNHSYSLGAIISGTSVGNAGRVFICTQAGTSTNGAAPAGFASAVDGGSVTDNGAKWQAGWRFSMTVTLSSPQPQLAGYLNSYVKAALPSSTFYIDPQIVL